MVHEVRWPLGARQVGILSRHSSVSAYLGSLDRLDHTAGARAAAVGMMFGSTELGRKERRPAIGGTSGDAEAAAEAEAEGEGGEVGWTTPPLFVNAGARWQLDSPIFSLAPSRVGLPFHNHGSA